MDVSVTTFRAELPSWIDRVRAGAEVVVTDHDYRGATVIKQRMPGARLIRASAVIREQSRDSARAT